MNSRARWSGTSPGPTARAGGVLAAAAGAAFLAFLDTTVANLAFPALREEFPSSSVADLSWVLTGYGVLFAAVLTPAGRLADVVGRRRLFAGSMILFTVASLLVAVAPTLPYLIAARVLQGAAAAGMIPSALALVLGYTRVERRMAAVGMWAGAGSMAAALGPSLGGLLVDSFSWRAAFLINVPIGALLVALTYHLVPRDAPSGRRLPDPLGTLLAVAGVGLVVLGLTEGGTWGWVSAATLGCLAAGAVLLSLALYRSMGHPAPAVEIRLWRNRLFAATNIASLLFGISIFAWLLIGPLFLTLVWDYSVLEAGLAMSPGAVASAVVAVIVGKTAGARGRRLAFVGGSLVMAGCALWFFRGLDHQPHFWTLFLPVNILSGAAIGAVLTALAGTASTALPQARFAAGTGLLVTARQFGGALGIAALAAILGAEPNLDGVVDVTLFCAVAAASAAIVGLAMAEGGTNARVLAPLARNEAPG
jgi:EmrB/QacA subfamily drug resistance transporter